MSVERSADKEGKPRMKAEYRGVDDNNTPEDESDDNHIYFVRFYELHDKKGRSASYGVMKLFDPDLKMVWEKRIEELYCEIHGSNDGLRAIEEGIEHGLVVKVPVSVMKNLGIYRFVVCLMDNHFDEYKGHEKKPVLELNANVEPKLYVWVGPNIFRKLIPYIKGKEIEIFRKAFAGKVNKAFNKIKVKIEWNFVESKKEIKVGAKGIHIYLEDLPKGTEDIAIAGYKYATATKIPRGATLGEVLVNVDAVIGAADNLWKIGVPNDYKEWAVANTIIRGMSYALSVEYHEHCKDINLRCVMQPFGQHYLNKIDNGKTVYIWLFKKYSIPLSAWHSVEEVFKIRQRIGLGRF
ncbi:MAG: hypothetical protein RMK18_12160 [Armatimonadota bacterium]|nr:hypothetical protein [Armatimonadota bacterium]